LAVVLSEQIRILGAAMTAVAITDSEASEANNMAAQMNQEPERTQLELRQEKIYRAISFVIGAFGINSFIFSHKQEKVPLPYTFDLLKPPCLNLPAARTRPDLWISMRDAFSPVGR
jgi:hypothetical protein